MFTAASQPQAPHTLPISAYNYDSPTLPGAYQSTPLQESHFDPHDPSWFTPQLTTSGQPNQSGFVHHHPSSDLAYAGHEEELVYDEGGHALMEHEVVADQHRRYSEGDYPLSGTSEREPYGQMVGYEEAPLAPSYFDSDYTLAPAPMPTGLSNETLQPPMSLISGEISPGTELYEHEIGKLAQPRGTYDQPLTLEDPAYPHYPISSRAQLANAEPFVIDLAAQSYSQGAYEADDALQQHHTNGLEAEPPTSVAPQIVYQPTPQRPVPQNMLQPSPYPPSSAPSSASATPLSSPFQLNPHSRRPSLAHAHTQAAPESVGHSAPAGQHYSPAPPVSTSVPRHHSYSGPSPQQRPSFQEQQYGPPSADEAPRRFSLQHGAANGSCGSPVAYAPYPSSATRRRSSGSLQHQSMSPSRGVGGASQAGMPATPRRLSNTPSTPSRLARGSHEYDYSPSSPYGPRTPARRSSGPTAPSPSTMSAGLMHPPQSNASPSFSSSARRGNPGLSISVDAAASFFEQQQRHEQHQQPPTASTGSMGPYRSPRYSPFSPFSPYPSSTFGTPATVDTGGFLSPASPNGLCSPSPVPVASRRRRYSADQPAARSGSAFHPSQAHTVARRASAEAAMGGSSLSGFAGAAASPGLSEPRSRGRSLAVGVRGARPLSSTLMDEHLDGGEGGGCGNGPVWTSSLQPPPIPQHHWQYQHEAKHHLGAHDWPMSAHGPKCGVSLEDLDPVGLGLEMGVEDMHLAGTGGASRGPGAPLSLSAPPSAMLGVAPAAMYDPYGGGPYDLAIQQQQHHGGVLQQQQQQAYEDLILASAGSAAQISRARNLRASPPSAEDQHERLQREIEEYLASPNRLELGERTVVVMNPKIAQRSYGTEKRLLAPPPMALLLGSSWWQTLDAHPSLSLAAASASGKLPSPPSPQQRATLAPEVYISISSDKVFPRQSASMSWISHEGKLILDRDEDDVPPLAGRAMSKSLAVSVAGELNKDISTTVNAVVTVCEPGLGDHEPRVYAKFVGKPMSVISKPSKKRSIVAGNIAGLHHGGLVSLYNRTKTYSGSTRYLCTSGISSIFPTQEWQSMAGLHTPRTFAPKDARDVRFVSKTNAWDAFVVYAVDVTGPQISASGSVPGAAQPGFPAPPPNAVPYDPKSQRALYYNQTVVLQDLATGVVSPILVLRRVDAKNVIVGGGSLEPVMPAPPNDPSLYPTLPNERLGEAVSAYRPIALEVCSDPSSPPPSAGPSLALTPDSFLGVVDEDVGVHQAAERRAYAKPPGEPASQPITPTRESFGGASHQQFDVHAPLPRSASAQQLSKMDELDGTYEPGAGRSKGSSRAAAAALAKSKKRGQSSTSLSTLAVGADQGKSRVWTLPLGDHCIWSMVQVEVARHTFFIPPSVQSMETPLRNGLPPRNHLYRTPRPHILIGPNIPTITSLEGPLASPSRDSEAGMLALHGQHLTPDLTIYLGSTPCPQIRFKSPELVLVRPPVGLAPTRLVGDQGALFGRLGLAAALAAGAKRVALVRPDGVVFPTQVCY
ncbi:hypothetical protein Rhopal_003948-T1 [Rhodotorula paludigena]|uniref:LAG1-DNAbind-domain-containing protein n=1 Tax=Rhodotorula paludigena TaxID=86838 RepID=A0AAV5GNV4_9BASI|nr:hypothetical protein Rhopal_003948-T1 [Rhodotorula paludigena]